MRSELHYTRFRPVLVISFVPLLVVEATELLIPTLSLPSWLLVVVVVVVVVVVAGVTVLLGETDRERTN